MDEVFGNSSSETVVSSDDLREDLEESRLQISQNLNDMKKSASCPTSPISLNFNLDKNNLNSKLRSTIGIEVPAFNQVSVIKSLEGICQSPNKDVFKISASPSVVLRHAKSILSTSPKEISPRSRGNSACLNNNIIKHHPYQNVPIPEHVKPSENTPLYANLPQIFKARYENVNDISKPDHMPIRKLHGSYIQLWNGVKERRSKLNREGHHKISENGYVSMSSPIVKSPNSSLMSDLANQLSCSSDVNIAGDIFCPFCPRPFTLEPNLKHHIQAIHRNELHKIVNENEPILIQYCPLCRGRFLNMDLLPSHLLEFHRDSLIDVLNYYENVRISGSEVKCPFCVKKISSNSLGEDLLLYHILHLHCDEYDQLIKRNFKPINCTRNKERITKLSTENLAHALSFKPYMVSTPGLSIKFKSLSCENSINNIEETWSPHCGKVENASDTTQSSDTNVTKGILRSNVDLNRKSCVKRELRFSVPPVTSEEFFIPESPESTNQYSRLQVPEQDENRCPNSADRQNIPVRIDSLSSADFIELNHLPSRKRRRIGGGVNTRKTFKKKKKDTIVDNVFEGLKSIGCPRTQNQQRIIRTSTTRTFRKPKSNSNQTVSANSPKMLRSNRLSLPAKRRLDSNSDASSEESTEGNNSCEESLESSPFESMKLFSPLRMFRCNSCRLKYYDNDSLSSHIKSRHRGILSILRPQYGCGICSSRFYENKYLVKHCLQHHTSLLEIRSPKNRKIKIYRFTED